MLLLLSPGQGSQSPGLLRPWLDLPGAIDSLRRWSDATGLDLLALGTQAPADAVRATEVAQPLLTAAALLGGGPVEESDVVAAGLQVATVNVAGQVVVGGPVEALDAWTPPSGARVRKLDVAG